MSGATLHDKLWDAHVVRAGPDGTALIRIDRHLVCGLDGMAATLTHGDEIAAHEAWLDAERRWRRPARA